MWRAGVVVKNECTTPYMCVCVCVLIFLFVIFFGFWDAISKPIQRASGGAPDPLFGNGGALFVVLSKIYLRRGGSVWVQETRETAGLRYLERVVRCLVVRWRKPSNCCCLHAPAPTLFGVLTAVLHEISLVGENLTCIVSIWFVNLLALGRRLPKD